MTLFCRLEKEQWVNQSVSQRIFSDRFSTHVISISKAINNSGRGTLFPSSWAHILHSRSHFHLIWYVRLVESELTRKTFFASPFSWRKWHSFRNLIKNYVVLALSISLFALLVVCFFFSSWLYFNKKCKENATASPILLVMATIFTNTSAKER